LYITKQTLIKHFTAVINAVWITISDLVEFFRNPIRIRFWIAKFGWIGIRKPDHVQHCQWAGEGQTGLVWGSNDL